MIEFAYPVLYKINSIYDEVLSQPTIYDEVIKYSDDLNSNWRLLTWLFNSDPTLGVVPNPEALVDEIERIPYLFDLCNISMINKKEPLSNKQKEAQCEIIRTVLKRMRAAIDEAALAGEGINFFLQRNLNYMHENGYTALMLAVESNRIDIVKELLNFNGIDVNQSSYKLKGATAHSFAKKLGNQDMLNLFEQCNTGYSRKSPLFFPIGQEPRGTSADLPAQLTSTSFP